MATITPMTVQMVWVFVEVVPNSVELR